jgi:hypothetical protein
MHVLLRVLAFAGPVVSLVYCRGPAMENAQRHLTVSYSVDRYCRVSSLVPPRVLFVDLKLFHHTQRLALNDEKG